MIIITAFIFFTKNLTNNIIRKNRFISFSFEFSEIFLNRQNYNSVFNFRQHILKKKVLEINSHR